MFETENKLISLFVENRLRIQSYQADQMIDNLSEVDQKVNSIRKSMRRDSIEAFFKRERTNLIDRRRSIQQLNGPDRQLVQVYKSIQDIVKSPQQIKGFSIQWLHPFMSRDAGCDAQLMASQILGEYLYHSETIPENATLALIIDLFKQSSNDILINCLRIIFTLISYFQNLKILFIENFDLANLIVNKIDEEKQQARTMILLMKLINSLIDLPEEVSPAELQILYGPLRWILQNEECDSEVCLLAVLNLRGLLKISPKESCSVVMLLTSILVPRLVKWFDEPRYETRRLAYSILDIIEFCRKDLAQSDVRNISISLIRGLKMLKYRSDGNLSRINHQILKEKGYGILLKLTEESTQIICSIFSSGNFQLAGILKQGLLEEEEKNIIVLIVKVLYMTSWHLEKLYPAFQVLKSGLPNMVPQEHRFNFLLWKNQVLEEEIAMDEEFLMEEEC